MARLRPSRNAQSLDEINASRLDLSSTDGFYESHFVRANHPSRPLAFWIRYTFFRSHNAGSPVIGQLWAVTFDAEADRFVALTQSYPMSQCSSSPGRLDIQIAGAIFDGSALQGSIEQNGHRLSWDLAYSGTGPPAFLLPMDFYDTGFPKAKVLTPVPLADFNGVIQIDAQVMTVSGWRGSQNHNWGTKHTDQYAWGQVCGFDNDPGAFLECSTARLKIGPLWSPWLTNLILRWDNTDISLTSIRQALHNRASYTRTSWVVTGRQGPFRLDVSFDADEARLVSLLYDDPPGGHKLCLNTKLAACSVAVRENGRLVAELKTSSRAAFETLTRAAPSGPDLAPGEYS
jgi:hypothetical protein